ncbi:hypothetical protein KCP78_16105 [Salmonella enterica subsp. enterica]|nr:hypothetical protein KCP78_16105 [Salmonella enterica subsp. enterica]
MATENSCGQQWRRREALFTASGSRSTASLGRFIVAGENRRIDTHTPTAHPYYPDVF